MGLFGGSKKFCPICGSPAGRFLATKVEGQPLCSDCGSKTARLPSSLNVKTMSLDQVREFIAFYDENAALRSAFQESYRYHFGFLNGDICLDASNRLLRFSVADNEVVFEASNIRSFCISEDDAPLFKGTQDALVCYQSAVPDRIEHLGPEIDRYLTELRQYEQMEQMEEILKKHAKETGQSYSPNYYYSPDVGRLKPFDQFWLKIELDHPYWSEQTYSRGAPGFSSQRPSTTDYLKEYEEKTASMRELAAQLMTVLNPDAPERQVELQAASDARTVPTAPGASAAPVDAVTEIQRYKELLDSGAITEEEFAAKKRQLLGI